MEELFQELLLQLRTLTEQLQQQSEQLQRQNEQLLALREENAAKDAQIAALTKKIEELTHKKNSDNSSTPPSANGYRKPSPKSLREKSDRKAGGQAGHKGNGMKIDRKPDEIREHRPEQCTGCSHAQGCHLRCCGTRYEYEAVVTTKLIAHQIIGCKHCRMTGEPVIGTFPAAITGTKQYGDGVRALVVSLLTIGFMSVDRVQKLLKSLRIPVSTGTIQSMLDSAAKKTEDAAKLISTKVSSLDVVNYDETGMRVAGKLHWLHCACNPRWRYYTIQEKRGQPGMEAMGIITESRGVAVHDFWKPYHKYGNVEHAMCCAHLERELVYAEEIGNQAWTVELRKLLQTMCHRRNVLRGEKQTAFPEEELKGYLERYDSLVEQGLEANPVPEHILGKRGRPGKGKLRCLLERFKNFKEDILRFARDWRIPYTNNTAEQAIRCAKVKEKISGCFRTRKGADHFAMLLSYLSSAALHGISSFDALLSAFKGDALLLASSWGD